MLKVCVRDITKFREEWLTLPMENFKEVFESMIPENHEYIITDFSHSLGSVISQYQNIYKLNDLLNELQYECDGFDFKDFELVAKYRFTSIEEIINVIKDERYMIFSDVATEEELGERIIEEELLTDVKIPQDLIDLGYIDFEAVGRNYSISKSVRFVLGSDEQNYAVQVF